MDLMVFESWVSISFPRMSAAFPILPLCLAQDVTVVQW